MTSPLFLLSRWFEDQRITVQNQIAALAMPLHSSPAMKGVNEELVQVRDLKSYMAQRCLKVNEEISRMLNLRSIFDYCISARSARYWETITKGFDEINQSSDKGGLPQDFINSFPASFAEQRMIWKQAERSWKNFKQRNLSNLNISLYEQDCMIKLAMSSRPTPYSSGEFTLQVLDSFLSDKPDQVVSFLLVKEFIRNKRPTYQTFLSAPFSRSIMADRANPLPGESWAKSQ